ncbi:global DNA-binding transcriptional dual regulator H-NS [Phocoenobacter uteri]|uniref:DNA-binding protein n=1 Tax=Phocoenobacter uteri TaxID=146806 RepID=A0A379CAH5_9PAST|nr:H-NS family nucleoid-associated regulatory protein [Phocoenobacter uteri]MDG6882533.1 hypothetical protein [Phocoenobacter uteri]SUB58696.1 global DNA-binding transcriptional dual regulator H-NS [Phocoenobacter uteri]
MAELFKILTNIRSLRKMANEYSLPELELALKKLTQVVEERKCDVKKRETAHKKYLENLSKYKKMLQEDGLTPEELASFLNSAKTGIKPRKKIKPRPAKYKYIDEFGNEKTWTGQGRTPKIIQKALNNGCLLTEFEI